MNLGILLALSSALVYGAADFIGGAGPRRHPSWQVVLVGQAAGALVILVAGLLGERLGAGQRTGLGICTLAVATLALG
ncbi:hypothetical protein ACQP1W_51315 [Spirillospora sp. CA-255316]